MILCLLHSLFSHFKLKIKLANRIYNICLLIEIITLLLAQVIQLVQYLFVLSCLWYHAQGCKIYGETQKNLEGWQYRLIIRHDISLLNTIWMSSLWCSICSHVLIIHTVSHLWELFYHNRINNFGVSFRCSWFSEFDNLIPRHDWYRDSLHTISTFSANR